MKLGAENKKSVYALIVLGVVAAYMVYSQLLSGPSYTPRPAATPTGDVTLPGPPAGNPGPDISRETAKPERPAARHSNGEFKPKLVPKNKEDRIANIAGIDPTIRMDLLEKVMKVPQAGAERDLFQILKAPPVKEAAVLKGPEPKVFVAQGPRMPPPPPPPPVAPPPAPPPPIPLKYYAYSAVHPDGKRTAFFMDGEEILPANEGTILKGRYRIVQIGTDKVIVEDTQNKRRQNVNIEPEVTG